MIRMLHYAPRTDEIEQETRMARLAGRKPGGTGGVVTVKAELFER